LASDLILPRGAADFILSNGATDLILSIEAAVFILLDLDKSMFAFFFVKLREVMASLLGVSLGVDFEC